MWLRCYVDLGFTCLGHYDAGLVLLALRVGWVGCIERARG